MLGLKKMALSQIGHRNIWSHTFKVPPSIETYTSNFVYQVCVHDWPARHETPLIFEHPNNSVSQKTARWYAWSASTKVETMLQSFYWSLIFAPLIKFVLKFSVFQLYYQGTVMHHKNPTNGKPQLPLVLHTPACIKALRRGGNRRHKSWNLANQSNCPERIRRQQRISKLICKHRLQTIGAHEQHPTVLNFGS